MLIVKVTLITCIYIYFVHVNIIINETQLLVFVEDQKLVKLGQQTLYWRCAFVLTELNIWIHTIKLKSANDRKDEIIWLLRHKSLDNRLNISNFCTWSSNSWKIDKLSWKMLIRIDFAALLKEHVPLKYIYILSLYSMPSKLTKNK